MIRRVLARAREAWVGYWFRPAPLLDLAVFRIVIVGYTLHAVLDPGRLAQAAERSRLPESLFDPPLLMALLAAPFGGAPPPWELVEGVYWLTVAVGILALVGLGTRVSLAAFALGALTFQLYQYSWSEFHHPEAVLLVALLALAASPAGGALSLDDLGRRLGRNATALRLRPADVTSERSAFARWPLLLVAWVFSLVYLSAAFCKVIYGEGAPWLNGYTLQYYMIQDGLRWGRPLGVWVGQHHWIALLGSWGAVLLEGGFWLVLVFPRLALVLIPSCVAFHSGIYLIQGAPFFSYFAVYTAFLPSARIVAWARGRLAGRSPTPTRLFYDGGCPLCIRSVTLLQYFDWLGRIDFRDLETSALPERVSVDEARREMHALLPDGSVLRGFFAVRHALARLPALWPLLALFHLPLAARLGPGLYARVAAARGRLEACPDGACSLHARPAAAVVGQPADS